MDAKTLERLLNQIAAEHLHIDTLATRNGGRALHARSTGAQDGLRFSGRYGE